jgi:glycine cleavage system H lipoate-binding protein
MLGNDMQGKVHPYLINDNSLKTYMSAFLGANVENLSGTLVENAGELLSALQNDPCGIGFCRLTDITDSEGQILNSNFRLIPLDVNNNGQLDYFEQIYGDLAGFTRGVYIGKYPKSLFSNIFAVSATQPAEGAELAFIRWMLSDGQQLLAENGYTELARGEAMAKAAGLNEGEVSVITLPEGPSVFRAFLVMLAVIAAGGLIAYALFRLVRVPGKGSPAFESVHNAAFSEKSLVIPKGLFFDKTHTWAFMERDGAVRIGIDDFIQHITGTVTRLKMKKPGEKIVKGEQILSLIQNGKQLNIYSPLSGTITSINETLIRNSSIINTSPYSDGWVYTIEPENWIKETRVMIMADKYSEWVREEFSRLKDFLAATLGGNELKLSQVVLQDGGEMMESLLEDFGPEVWEDFQTGFIDKSK